MCKVIPFPAAEAASDFDKLNKGFLTEEERQQATENLAAHYAEQAAREAAYRANGREITLEQLAARLEYQARREQPTPNADGVRIGDLFYGSWGYEQTNVDFFQVVALRGKHTAVLARIARDYVGGFSMSGTVRPCRDEFVDGEQHTVRTKTVEWYGNTRLMMNHPTASGHKLDPITDDKEVAYSSYY